MTPAVPVFDDIAHDILAVLVAAYTTDDPAGLPAWQAVTPSRVVHELCMTDQIAVWFIGARASGPLNQSSGRPQSCGVVTVADFGLSVVRCMASAAVSNPQPATIEADSLRLAKDARLVWFGITGAVKADQIASGCTEISYSGLTVSEPNGGKAAVTMLLSVSL